MMRLLQWIYKKRQAFLWATIILLLFITLLPGDKIPMMPNWKSLLQPDKIIHLVSFAGLQFILLLNIRKYTYWKNILISIFIGLFFGVATEVLQGILPINRTMTIYDMIANAAGILLGFLFWRATAKKIETVE
ncbi:VanZ family protein [Bacteroidales bacterium OttesenSCG-928-C19]|nr:VanZ family protein [Bacteroidales bacterium OttesenSCG-928-C19]